ncbi:MAG: AsmA-like C-terminal domain-containing protein [Pseudomonadota bacterium]
MGEEQTEDVPERRAKPKRGLKWRAFQLIAGLATSVFTIALLLIGGVYLRLTAGPIDLTPYLPSIQAAISRNLSGADVELGSATISLAGANGGAALVVDDIVLVDDQDGPFARVPEARGQFRIWDVVQGEFLPSNVTLKGISARLVRDADGAFRFGFGGLADNEAGGQGSGAFNRLLSSIGAADTGETQAVPEPGRGQVLKLEDAEIFYSDQLSRRQFRSTAAELTFWRSATTVTAVAALSLDGGQHGPLDIRMRGHLREDGDIDIDARFENAAPRDLGDQIRALDWMAAFEASVSGHISLGMNEGGDLTALSGQIIGGAGQLNLGADLHEPIRATRLVFDYLPAEERFLITEALLDADRATVVGHGFVEVNRDEAGEPRDVVAQLDFENIDVALPEVLDSPLTYERGRATGRVTLDPFVIEIGELRLERPTAMQVTAAGRLWLEGDDWHADLTAGASDFSLEEMLSHWPRTAAPGALVWMRDNMEQAHVIDTDAVIRIGGETEEVKIDFTFDNAIGHYLRPMPPIRGGVGSGQVDLKRFSLALDQGNVRTDGGELIDLSGSTFVIEDLEHPSTPGTANIVARGRIADALALIDSEPLRLTSALGVPLGDVGGQAVVTAVSTFPLLKDLLLEDVTADAKAEFTDVEMVVPGLGKTARAKTLNMDASTSGFALEGTATVSGLPVALNWKERFSPAERAITARATATPARLAAFGIEQNWFTDGAIPIRATVSPGEATTFSLSADLDQAELNIPEIVWRKGVGAKGALSAEGAVRGDKITLDALSFETADLAFSGTARTDQRGAPKALDLTQLRYREAIDLGLKAVLRKGRWVVDAKGALLDLTQMEEITDRIVDGENVSGGGPFLARIDIERLRASEDQFFSNVTGRALRDEAGLLTIKVSANVAGGAGVDINVKRGPEGGSATLRTDDAGRLLRDAGIFDDGAGGVLLIRASIPPGDALRFDGRATVDDIIIHEDAKLEQLLLGADLEDLRETMRDDGIIFNKIRAPFSFDGDRVVLREAVATGPSIGVNISGDFALEEEVLDIDGVFTPLYTLNAAVGNIPVIGQLLTGGDGQGLFAFNFSVKGSADDPRVRVNPLSVLTPGIFRRIFDIGEGSQQIDPSQPENATRQGR